LTRRLVLFPGRGEVNGEVEREHLPAADVAISGCETVAAFTVYTQTRGLSTEADRR
jgi:hypothetical protein